MEFTAALPSSARHTTDPRVDRPRPSKLRGRHAIGKVSFLRSRGPDILQPGGGHGVRCVQALDDVDPDEPDPGRTRTSTTARCSLRRLDPRRQPCRIAAASALLPFVPHRHEVDGDRSAAHDTLRERLASRRSTEPSGLRPGSRFFLPCRCCTALTEAFAVPSHASRRVGLPHRALAMRTPAGDRLGLAAPPSGRHAARELTTLLALARTPLPPRWERSTLPTNRHRPRSRASAPFPVHPSTVPDRVVPRSSALRSELRAAGRLQGLAPPTSLDDVHRCR